MSSKLTEQPLPLAAFPRYERPETDHLPILDPETLPRTMFWTVLSTALTMRRDHESPTEAAFVGWLINRLPVSYIDTAGNVYVDLRSSPEHRTMFTAHTDTVHNGGGPNTVRVDGDIWRADKGAALGADDGAGIAILCHMISEGVPGLYVFFRGEERGGVGSTWAARNMSEMFEDLDRAVAFDRADFYDVITYQSGGRCCSDEFAQALSNELSSETSWYMPCDGGVYTDTAEFIRLIPECTNISVGYKNQHGDRESQDVVFLWDLAQRAAKVPWDTLPVARDPKVIESRYSKYYTPMSDHGKYDDWVDEYYGIRDASTSAITRIPDQLQTSTELDVDAEEDLFYEAIDLAYAGHPHVLIDIFAVSSYPDDPDLAASMLSPTLFTEQVLDRILEMYDEGWTIYGIADQMFNDYANA